MPPISTGRDADFGMTSRFAPRLRSSRFTRSPISSMAPSMAVATAEPRATAPIAMALRRGARRIDSPTKRKNKSAAPGPEDFRACQQLRCGDQDLAVLDPRFERNGIAAARCADGGNVDSRGAILANDVGTLLIVALAPADLAGIEGDGDGLIGAADSDDAHSHAVGCDGEA